MQFARAQGPRTVRLAYVDVPEGQPEPDARIIAPEERLGFGIFVRAEVEDFVYMVPVSAHSTEIEGKPVWLVYLDWEYESTTVPLRYCDVGHTRNFAFDRNTLQLVARGSCD